MPARTAAELNAALLKRVTRNLAYLNAALDWIGWCDDLPTWPRSFLAAPPDIYLLQAHALDVAYRIAEAECACHRGERGRAARDVITGWRVVVDHAISFTVLSPAGRAGNLQTYRNRYLAVEATFQRHVNDLLSR